MNLSYCIERLSTNVIIIEGLARKLSAQQARWKPQPDKWSILEVINHLYDEEREDFRARLDLLLHQPEKRWPPIDPPKWAVERAYNQRDIGQSWESFLKERSISIDWLMSLENPQFENKYEHPEGVISAGDLLSSWVAHDLLHIKQLARLHWEYLNSVSAPYQTGYAGKWY
jgi:DinB superfamily